MKSSGCVVQVKMRPEVERCIPVVCALGCVVMIGVTQSHRHLFWTHAFGAMVSVEVPWHTHKF